MEEWYAHRQSKSIKTVKFRDYEIMYIKKGYHENFEPKNGKMPVDLEREQVKVIKGGEKIKIRKKSKLAIIDAINQDNIDKLNDIVKTLENK
jgi:hypothetical protein